MARKRTIDPEIAQSRSMKAVSRDARLLFKLLITSADDAGRARANVPLLAVNLFPADTDASMMLPAWMDELERQGCIKRYVVEREEYLLLVNWRKWQTVDRPTASRLPPPPSSGLAKDSRAAREEARSSLEGLGNSEDSRAARDGNSAALLDSEPPGEITEQSILADFERIQRRAERLEILTPALRAAELKARLKGLLGNGRTDKKGSDTGPMADDYIPDVADVVRPPDYARPR